MPHNSHQQTENLRGQELVGQMKTLHVDGIEGVDNSAWLSSQSAILSGAIERQFAGTTIHIVELPIAKVLGERAISRWARKNEHQIQIGPPLPDVEYVDLRSHPKTRIRYLENDMFRYARQTTGVIEAVDTKFGSLVVRPNIARLWGDRNWIKVLSRNGDPLVTITCLNGDR